MWPRESRSWESGRPSDGIEVRGFGIRKSRIPNPDSQIPSVKLRGMKAVLFSLLLAVPLAAQTADKLTAKNVAIKQMTFKGRSATQVVAAVDAPNATSYAIVKDATFRDGTIEVDLAGQPAAGAGGGARGFIGMAFRMQADGKYEYIYLRPTKGGGDAP